MRRHGHARRRSGAPALLALLLALATGRCVGAQESGDSAAPPLDEPIDLRRAELAELLALPGMDAVTAAALLTCRRRGDLDLEGVLECAGVTTARRAEWRAGLLWEPERTGPTAAATLTLRGRGGGADAGGAATLPPPPTWLRRELRVRARAGNVGIAGRLRRDREASPADADAAADSPTGAFRVVLADGTVRVTGGDFAPHDGLGCLVGLAARGAPRGVLPFRAPAAGLDGWAPLRSVALDRASPAATARRLRGGSLLFGGRVLLAAFRYLPGETGTSVDSLAGRLALPGAVAGVWFGAAPASAPRGRWSAAPRILWLDRRVWPGLLLSREADGLRLQAEVARDPAGRLKAGVTLERGGGGSTVVQWTAQGGSPAFVNPLAVDSERAPTAGAPPSDARNTAAAGAGLEIRHRVRPGLWLTTAAAATLEPSSSRRAYRRGRGDLSAGLDASLGAGWSARTEFRSEVRDSPGSATDGEGPLRRPGFLIRVNQDGKGRHLRAGWFTRIDFEPERGGAANPGVARVVTSADIRGRVRVGSDVWLGGGVALYDLPAGEFHSLYEERPRDLPPAATVRGRGTRGHLAFEVALPFGSAGAFLAREKYDESHNTFWGSVLRVRVEPGFSRGTN